MAFEVEEKTERPTERRRRLAREQGQGPRSGDLSSACRLLGAAAALQWFGGRLALELSRFLQESLQRPVTGKLDSSLVTARLGDAVACVAAPLLGCCACLLATGLLAQWLQVGFRWQVADLLPDAARLNPLNGLGRIWRWENSVQALLGLLKYLAVLGCGGVSLWSNLGQLALLTESDGATIAQIVGGSVLALAWQLAAVYLAFGLADYGYQNWKFEHSLKMSPDEVREEARLQAGDPRWKQQRQQIWRQHARTLAPIEATTTE